MPTVRDTRWHGLPALALEAGPTRAVVLPGLGMTVVSLFLSGSDVVATPGGASRLRQGHTTAVPLLAPWANRLHSFVFEVAGRRVDVATTRTRTDDRGLPIHGLLVGATGWQVLQRSGSPSAAQVTAVRDLTEAEFAFPHRLEVTLRLTAGGLEMATTVAAALGSPAPVAVGWHPYLTLPTARPGWVLTLPDREHLQLDDLGLPTGGATHEEAEQRPLGRRRFDDLYAVSSDARLALASPAGAGVALELVEGYRYAQVWVPPRRRYAALEPMSVPTDALARGAAPMVEQGGRRTLVFALTG